MELTEAITIVIQMKRAMRVKGPTRELVLQARRHPAGSDGPSQAEMEFDASVKERYEAFKMVAATGEAELTVAMSRMGIPANG